PHQHLHLRRSPIEEEEDVRVGLEHAPHLVRQTLERLSQIRALRRHVDAHRAWQNDHDRRSRIAVSVTPTHAAVSVVSSRTSSRPTPSTTSATGARSWVNASRTTTGTNDARGAPWSFKPRRFTHHCSRCAPNPFRRANASSDPPTARHSLDTRRASASVHRVPVPLPCFIDRSPSRQRGARTTLDDRQPAVRGAGGRVDTFVKS